MQLRSYISLLVLLLFLPASLGSQSIGGKVVIGGKVSIGWGTTGVPSEFTDLYTFQLSRLNNVYNNNVLTSWDGIVHEPPCQAIELTPADALGIQQSGYYNTYVSPFVDRAVDIGVNCFKVQIGFPHLYRPYHDWLWNGAGCAYNSGGGCSSTLADAHWNAEVAFWQQVRSDLTARGMKLNVQAAVQGSAGSELNNPSLAYYYDTIDWAAYKTGRTTNNVNVVTLVQPDYINVMSEPTHEYLQVAGTDGNTRIPELTATPSNCATPGNIATCNLEAKINELWLAMSAGLEAIPINHTTTKVAVGLATGVYDNLYIMQLESTFTNCDILDAHLHGITNTGTNDSIVQIITMANLAISAGKGFGMNEESVDKSRPGSPGPTPNEQGGGGQAYIYDRQWYTFWNPDSNANNGVDLAFIRLMIAICSWKAETGTVYYYSYSEPYQFYHLYNYYNVPGCPPPSDSCAAGTITSMNSVAATANINSGQSTTSILTNIGLYYKNALALTNGAVWNL